MHPITNNLQQYSLSLVLSKIKNMQKTVPYRSWLPMSSEPQMSHHSSLTDVNSEDPLKENGVEINKFEGVRDMVTENAVLVFARHGCCMCHVVKRLLLGLGVNPAVYEVGDEKDEIVLIHELEKFSSHVHEQGGRSSSTTTTTTTTTTTSSCSSSSMLKPEFPCVYVGGKLFGGLDQLMGAHISGDLVPILKQVGALWL